MIDVLTTTKSRTFQEFLRYALLLLSWLYINPDEITLSINSSANMTVKERSRYDNIILKSLSGFSKGLSIASNNELIKIQTI